MTSFITLNEWQRILMQTNSIPPFIYISLFKNKYYICVSKLMNKYFLLQLNASYQFGNTVLPINIIKL